MLLVGNEAAIYFGGERVYYTATDAEQDARYVHRLTFDSPSFVVYYTDRTFPTAAGPIPATTTDRRRRSRSTSGDNTVHDRRRRTPARPRQHGRRQRPRRGPLDQRPDERQHRHRRRPRLRRQRGGPLERLHGAATVDPTFDNCRGDGNSIAALLTIDGGTGFDQVDVDDTADNVDDTGTLTTRC